LQLKKKISPRHDFTRKTKKRKCEQQEKVKKKNESEIPSISSFDYKKHKYYTDMKMKEKKNYNCATK